MRRSKTEAQAERLTGPMVILRMADVASRLGKSTRWLQDHLKAYPAGRMAGRTRLFTEDDFDAIMRSLPTAQEVQARRANPSGRQPRSRQFRPLRSPSEEETWIALQKLFPEKKEQRRTSRRQAPSALTQTADLQKDQSRPKRKPK